MTISTLSFQTNATEQMDALETALSQTQSELSTGLSLQNAADNPSAMTEVNQLNAQLSASQQYVTNGTAGTTSLDLENGALTDSTNALQSARSLALEANNSSLSLTDRQNIATQLEQLQQTLLSAANTTDSSGNFLFAGTANSTQPFVQSAGSVSYVGNDQVNQLQISANQSISAGDSGSSVFMNLQAGNGTFTTSVGAGNTGTATIDPGSVTDPSQWVPDTYTISFSSPTAYQVTNSAGTVVSSGAYTSGDAIQFSGAEVDISGTPAAGDTFTAAPAGKASVFSTISGLINTLNSTTLSSAQIASQIGTGVQQIDTALNNLDNVSASVGGRLNAITTAGTDAQSQQTDIQSTVSKLSNVDYASAVTQLSTQELALQAAQESYASIAKLSLFNYLS